MKTAHKIWLAIIVLAMAATFYGMFEPLLVRGQSFGAQGIGPIAPTLAQCPAGVASEAFLCPVGSGTTFQMYVSYNGGAYVVLGGSGGTVVTSFNGRTGAVSSQIGDYSFSQLSSPPTSVTAGTFSLTGATIK